MAIIPPSADLPYMTVKRHLDADAEQRLLEFAYAEVYDVPVGSNRHIEDGYAEPIDALIDYWEAEHDEG